MCEKRGMERELFSRDDELGQLPLFPELAGLLQQALEEQVLKDDGGKSADYAITRCRNSKTNLPTQMERIIQRSCSTTCDLLGRLS
jgi:hypothetical protein